MVSGRLEVRCVGTNRSQRAPLRARSHLSQRRMLGGLTYPLYNPPLSFNWPVVAVVDGTVTQDLTVLEVACICALSPNQTNKPGPGPLVLFNRDKGVHSTHVPPAACRLFVGAPGRLRTGGQGRARPACLWRADFSSGTRQCDEILKICTSDSDVARRQVTGMCAVVVCGACSPPLSHH